MVKKTYINPTVSVVALHQADGILTSLSGGDTLKTGGSTSKLGGSVDADVREDSGWDVW